MLTAQTEMSLDYSSDVETAFGDGRLSIIVDDERSLSLHLSFIARPAKWDGRGAVVHVVSRPAGGEIRGYVLIAGVLHLRLPNYAGEWPELDAAVERRLNARAAKDGDVCDCNTRTTHPKSSHGSGGRAVDPGETFATHGVTLAGSTAKEPR